MKLSIIAPIQDLELSKRLSNYYMVLSWLALEQPNYCQFYKDIKKNDKKSFIILDNGAAENKPIDGRQLIELAQEMKVDELVLPDAYGDGNKTTVLSNEFIDNHIKLIKKMKLLLMGVVQGTTKEEFLRCYDNFLNNNNIKTIGIGYRNLLHPFLREMEQFSHNYWEELGIKDVRYLVNKLENNTFYYMLSRLYFIRNYVNFEELKKNKKKIHLLGLWSPRELAYYHKVFDKNELEFIRSNDSASVCQAAQTNIYYDKTYGTMNKPKRILDFYRKLTLEELAIVDYNINIIKEWISNV